MSTKTKQTVYAPKYYKKFKCIADKCQHSCCVGWEIDIDRESEEKYSRLCGGYGENIKKASRTATVLFSSLTSANAVRTLMKTDFAE